METKTKLMDSMIVKVGGFFCGAFASLFSGHFHIDLHLLQVNLWEQVFKLSFELFKVGMAGMIGAAGGLTGKKYLFPLFDKYYKKIFTTNKKNKS